VAPKTESLLHLQDAGRRIDGRWLWRGISFSLDPGERLAVAGASGSGKTLLLRAVAGLDRLDEGTVTHRGREPDEWRMPEYRARVTYLAQTPALVEGTVEENLRLPFDFRVHGDRSYDRRRILGYLDRLERGADFLDRDADDLSGGERQLVALLRVVQLEPAVLLLDEPTAGLDEALVNEVEALVGEWLGDGERGAVWTSHHSAQLERVTDRRLDVGDFKPSDGDS
jgi:putative ABC transport system ATP-binding protein